MSKIQFVSGKRLATIKKVMPTAALYVQVEGGWYGFERENTFTPTGKEKKVVKNCEQMSLAQYIAKWRE